VGQYEISVLHIDGDPVSVYRLYVVTPLGLKIELTPSKGLSVRDCTYQNRQMFWDSPMENLPDPEEVDLRSTVICDGVPVPGNGWIKYFASHVELLGLKNWGVGRELPDGSQYSLHGNVSNIPVETVDIDIVDNGLRVRGSFDVYGADEILAVPGELPDYAIERSIYLSDDKPAVYLADRITNLTNHVITPDWGYHVQLKPEEGCRLLFPYKSVSERFGNPVPENHNVWTKAHVEENREERGYVYRGLKKEPCFQDGSEGIRGLLKYQDKPGIEIIMPYAPYTMGWFSCGGGKGENFMIPSDQPGVPPRKMLEKNWDGIGPEIGASDLDHGDNVDPDAKISVLSAGESMVLQIELRFLDQIETDFYEKEVLNYLKG
jgi:hypothetical protein